LVRNLPRSIRLERQTTMAQRLFPRNTHKIERAARVLLGLGLLTIALVGPKTPWGILGLVPLVTGILGSCPLYTLLGISTCPVKAP
jgi:hypothetical protein